MCLHCFAIVAVVDCVPIWMISNGNFRLYDQQRNTPHGTATQTPIPATTRRNQATSPEICLSPATSGRMVNKVALSSSSFYHQSLLLASWLQSTSAFLARVQIDWKLEPSVGARHRWLSLSTHLLLCLHMTTGQSRASLRNQFNVGISCQAFAVNHT